MSFERIDLQYVPRDIGIEEVLANAGIDASTLVTREVVEKLMAHLKAIKEWKDRIDAIKYLTDKAEELAENPVYISTDQSVCLAIESFGGKNGKVDFELFKECIETVLEGYRQTALVSMTGVA